MLYSDMVWGILAALEEEVLPVIDKISHRKKSRWNRKSIHRGRVMDHEVVVMSTGLGKVSAAASVQYLIDNYPVEKIIFTGMAGAINPDLVMGDIIIGLKAVQHDFDMGGKKNFEQMKTPWFETDPRLVGLAIRTGHMLELGERVKTGIVLTGDQAIVDSQQRECLRHTFGGDCVEMEGASAALVCSQNNVPFLLIRIISDLADKHARDDFRRSLTQSAEDLGTLILGMLGKINPAGKSTA